MLQSAGQSLFDDEGNPTITDNAALADAIDIYSQMVEAGIYLEVNSWDEYIGSLVNGNVAGTINGIWISGSLQTAEDQSGKWNMTNLPIVDGIDGATHYSANGGSSWAVSSNANVEPRDGLPRLDLRRFDRACTTRSSPPPARWRTGCLLVTRTSTPSPRSSSVDSPSTPT
ncbi:extracellular solute-binding protein [Demequina litorisediminis]